MILECTVEYQGISDTWSDGSCTPGTEKPTTCAACTCGKDSIGIVDWCNESKEWVHACKFNVCVGKSILLHPGQRCCKIGV